MPSPPYAQSGFLSTLSVRRATNNRLPIASGLCLISIHALREESDGEFVCDRIYELISIHALREESDD